MNSPENRPSTELVAVVTGGLGGIGRAVVNRLGADGYSVTAFDVVNAADTSGSAAVHVDVTEAASLRAAIAAVVSVQGRLDVVVNCAGTAYRGSFEETSVEAFMGDVRTNLLGTFLMCQAAVFPHMKSAGSGGLINIASISGKRGGIGPVDPTGAGGRTGAGYAASKAGVLNLTRWIAREVGPLGIRCNAIAPGMVRTPMTEGHRYELDDVPLGRPGGAEEIADAVAWLAGPGSTYVHGAVIDVDGGLVRA